MAIPSEITVPVKVKPKVSVGLATYLGAGGAASGLSAAVLAFVLGDHSPETQTAIVSGAAVGLGSLLATIVGRYAQAHATIARTGAQLVGPSVDVVNRLVPLEQGQALAASAPVLGEVRFGDGVARAGDVADLRELVERVLDHVQPRDQADHLVEGGVEGDVDEGDGEPVPLDAIDDPPPLNAEPTPPPGEPRP